MPPDQDPLASLVAQNSELRRRLSLGERDPRAQETIDWLEKENEILERQLAIHEKWKAKLETADGRMEALFALQFFSSIPLPLWTSDLQEKITSWNDFASETYKHTSEKALGKNFINLFVRPPEQDQAREDLFAIVHGQEGHVHLNLCTDEDRHKRKLYLVTCCFPVFDPRNSAVAQAEVSFDLSRLQDLQVELEEMQANYRIKQEAADKTRAERTQRMVSELTASLMSEVRDQCAQERLTIKAAMEVNQSFLKANSKAQPEEQRLHTSALESHKQRLEEIARWEHAMIERIEDAPETVKDLQAIRVVIRKGPT